MGPFIPRRGTVNAEEDRPDTQGHTDASVEGGHIVCECGWRTLLSVVDLRTTPRQVSDEWYAHRREMEIIASMLRSLNERRT